MLVYKHTITRWIDFRNQIYVNFFYIWFIKTMTLRCQIITYCPLNIYAYILLIYKLSVWSMVMLRLSRFPSIAHLSEQEQPCLNCLPSLHAEMAASKLNTFSVTSTLRILLSKHKPCSHCLPFTHSDMVALKLITSGGMPALRIPLSFDNPCTHCLPPLYAEMAAL